MNRFYRIAIVGSGPSGFYTAKYLIDKNPLIKVDIIEKLPTPYGLVRYGVAPDHQEVKAVTNTFDEIACNSNVRYLGNVCISQQNGNDTSSVHRNIVTLDRLRKLYSCVVLAYGASSDTLLNIENEAANGIFSARSFVNWYNGHPEYRHISNKLNFKDVTDVVIIGNGNVAVDCARILAKSVDELEKTDICIDALHALKRSQIKNIHMVGRRGHVQSSFTIKELRELSRLANATCLISKEELAAGLTDSTVKEIEDNRPKKRIVELINTIADSITSDDTKYVDDGAKRKIHIKFLLSPTEFLTDSNDRVSGVKFEVNKLTGMPHHQKSVGTGETTVVNSQLVLKSVGYQSESVDDRFFDTKRKIVPNIGGRVLTVSASSTVESLSNSAAIEPGLYTVGWLKRGPSGIIGTNITDAKETTASILADIAMDKVGQVWCEEFNRNDLLTTCKQPVVTWDKYRIIDQEELNRGKLGCKIREKILSVNEMIHIINDNKQ